METAIMSAMCRCCASEGVFKDVKSSYTWMGDEEVYADMLRECFDIHLSTSEHCEDGGICEVCITQLRNASNFKKQVLHTEEQFKKHINNKLFKPSIVKVEVSAEEDNDSDDNNMSAEEAYSGPEFEIPIKTETEEPKPKKRAASSKATTSRAKKAKGDSGESSSKRHPAHTVNIKKEEKHPDDTKKKKGHPVETDNVKKEEKQPAGANKKRRGLSKLKQDLQIKIQKDDIHKHRINVKELMLWSNATPIRRFEDMGYMCCYCKDQFPNPADLKKHTLETHQDVRKAFFMKLGLDALVIRLDITDLQCKICSKNLVTLEQLFEHLKVDHQKIIYNDVKNHITPLKFDTEALQCFMCLNTFRKFKLLLEHMNLHYRNYICKFCDAGFTSIRSFRCHMLSHNTGSFKCDYCPQAFETKAKKNMHEVIKHENNTKQKKPKLHRCGYCNETFSEYRAKESHLISMHGMKVLTLKCQACEKVFKTRRALTVHVKRDHLMERRNKCAECDMSFFSASDLKDHMVKHSGLKSFKCTICLKNFCRAKTLKEHMKIHDNVRRFKCEHCGQTFVQKCSWRGHMKSKHAEVV